ncbi:hypothetical protein PAMP_005966 [Pampus punctatissimus]
MEAELLHQLSSLRAEIEENGFPCGAVPSKSYSSVQPPKDISVFRLEREQTLRRGLQVAETLPVQSQSDVMQRELESCLSLEYTSDSLPPLLHQFYTDRSYHMAQIKYLLMLRWRRFCHHTSVIEKLYPHYKDHMSRLTSAYEDAVQRARRLSASKEKILTGRGDTSSLLTRDDVVIYLQWLVCHLHSVLNIHNFLRVLHYIPFSERKNKESQPTVAKDLKETLHPNQHADGVSVPLHTVHLEEFLPELQALITYFHLSYDAEKIRTTADEMELFSMVWREFRTIFRHQEQVKTFPQYDGTDVKASQWGRTSGSMALKKEASWIPFIQVKPKRDPSQQKLVTKLKEKKSLDELLKMHSRFLQVPDLHHAAATLKEHAVHVGDLQSAMKPSVSNSSKTKQQNISKIWTRVYNPASLTQAPASASSLQHSYSLEDSLQLLGLIDGPDVGTSDPIITRGAYLSLIYLRHLKIRQLQRSSLGMLNYLRSVERTLTFDLAGLQLEERELCSTAEETGWMNAARGGRGEAGGLGSLQYSHNTPVDYKVHCSEFMEFAEVENLHDFYRTEEHFIHTQDQRGFYIMYDAALRDLEELENELLLVGSHFIQTNTMKQTGIAERGSTSTADPRSRAGTNVDRVALLLDLWTCETEFLGSKIELLNCYYEAYQHAAGTEERFALAQVITDIMHSRPHLDLNHDYFVQAYRDEIRCLQSHQQLIKDVLDNQIEKQRQYLQRIWRSDSKDSIHDYGLPPNYVPKHLVSLGGSRHLFSDVFFEDPILVQRVGLSLVRSAEEKNVKQRREKQSYVVETFSKLLELITIRHRLLESASETAHLAQLYRNVASDLGFDEFHLYMRPVQFEVAEQKIQVEQRPVFITAILEDDSCVDRFTPSHLPLSIQELDENQIGRFSFSSEAAVVHLMNKQSIENLQVTLACQVTQKNALISAVKLACLCYWAEEAEESFHSSLSKSSARTTTSTKERLMEAFVSIQLEKVGLRDEMLNSFMKKKQAVGGLIKTPDEATKIKRRLIIDFLKKFSTQISQHCVRAQIVAYYYSLTSILDGLPSIRQSYFMSSHDSRPKTPELDSGVDCCPDPRTFRRRPQQFLSADGKTLFNLWYIPHFSEVLHMFRTLEVSASAAALDYTLQIVSALHDIIYYLVSFSRLGNVDDTCNWRTGQEATGAELLEIQRQVDCLSDPSSPESVGRLLQLRRQVVLLQFDAAVRHLIRESFLSSGDMFSYFTVSDNMATALPLLSNINQTDVFSLTLPVPRPIETNGCQAQTMYPWRSFITCHGLIPLHVWDIPPIEHCMQLCLSGLSDRSRLQANAAILGVSLLMEDVLTSGREAEPVRLHGNRDDLPHDGKPNEGGKSCLEAEEEEKTTPVSDFTDSSVRLQDPIRVQRVLRGFLLLMKQLQVFKENWALRHVGAEMFSTPGLYQQFIKLYRAEIFYPSMRALAQQMGKERDYEVLISGSQSLLNPPGASEVDVKAWQLHRLLESVECDMIRALQRRINRELTLVVSERTRQDTGLPTELWKKSTVKYSLSPERPQIVESFIQQLMEGSEEADGHLRISIDHLQQCLTHLGCSVMERERRSFLLYSQFYEQILQQQTQLLYQKEQVAVLYRGMILEMSALQVRVAHLEEEKRSREQKLSLKFKERYDPLVRQLFSTCIQLKARLDEYRRQMEQDVSVMVNSVRREGVDRIIRLRKKYGCTKDNNELTLTQLKREISSRIEALRVKMTSEEEVLYLQQELDAARQALTCCQTECSSTKKLLSRKVRGQLQQERCLKQEAFQQVDKLQNQVSDMETGAFSRCTSTAGQSRTYYTLSVSRLSTRSPSAGLQRASQQFALQLGSLTNDTTPQDFAAVPRKHKAEAAGSRSNTRMDRPKAHPSRLRVLTAEATLPDL